MSKSGSPSSVGMFPTGADGDGVDVTTGDCVDVGMFPVGADGDGVDVATGDGVDVATGDGVDVGTGDGVDVGTEDGTDTGTWDSPLASIGDGDDLASLGDGVCATSEDLHGIHTLEGDEVDDVWLALGGSNLTT